MKKNIFPPLLLALALFTGELASAQNPPGRAWSQVIQGLQKEGIQKVGDFDLTKFSQEAQQISWSKNSGAAPSLVAGERTSAYYRVDKKAVYISDNLPPETLASLPDLELHEALGALGYEDNSYVLSSALRTLLDVKEPQKRQQLLREYGQDLFSKPSLKIRTEGGSGVGGGGDIRALVIKHQVLSSLLRTHPRISSDFLVIYPQINFEPVYAASLDYVSLQYKYQSLKGVQSGQVFPRVPLKNGRQEQFTVYIPVAFWDKKESRPALLEEVKRKILGLFAVEAKTAGAITLSLCQGTKQMNFPSTQDHSVLTIQKIRGEMNLGCDPTQDFATTVWAPSLPDDAMPPVAGSLYYTCQYVGPAGQINLRFGVAAQGQGLLKIHHAEVGPQADLQALTQFDGNGNLIRMFFLLNEDGKSTRTPFREVKSMKDASIDYDYKGAKINFNCKRN